jgi:hypothetical protein
MGGGGNGKRLLVALAAASAVFFALAAPDLGGALGIAKSPSANSSVGTASAVGSQSAVGNCSDVGSYSSVGACSVPVSEAGTISGRVTDGAGNGIPGICVFFYAGGGTVQWDHYATTAANGTYSLDDLPTVSFDVQFMDGCGNVKAYAPQWYDNAATEKAATPVKVSAAQTTQGINAMLAAAGTITGTVTDTSSNPLVGVCVSADTAGSTQQAASTVTGYGGTYTLTDVATGNYDIEFSPRCGVSGTYATQWYDNVTSLSAATAVSVTAGATVTGVDDSLAGPGQISGAVTASGGSPIFGICVLAYPSSPSSSNLLDGYAYTALDGTYTVTGLSPGSYDVEFFTGCGASGGYQPQWYDNVASPAAATSVTVTSGATTPGVNDTLKSVSSTVDSIWGTVTTGSSWQSGVCVLAFAAGTTTEYGSTVTAANGSYDLYVSPGSYDVEFTDTAYNCNGASNLVTQWYKGASSESTATTVTADSSTPNPAGVNAAMVKGGTISGKVTDGALRGLAGVCVDAYSGVSTVASGDAVTASNGTYTISGLGTGTYDVEFVGSCNSSGSYGTLWYVNSATRAGVTAVSVTAGGSTPNVGAKLTVAPTGGISGTVTDAAATTLPGICVDIDPAGSPNPVATTTTGGRGTFKVTGLNPGSYDVYYDPSCDPLAPFAGQWYSGASQQSAATAVGVTKGVIATNINATLGRLPSGWIDGIVTKGGKKPIPGVCAEVYEAGTTTFVGSTPTDPNGSYTVVDLPAGKYNVEFSSCNELNGYATQWYDGVSTQATARAVPVALGQETTGIDATLVPTVGAISGKVTSGPTTGIPGVCVGAYLPGSNYELVASTVTLSTGAYTLKTLPLGQYDVDFSPQCGAPSGYTGQFYRDASNEQNANLVSVNLNKTTSGVNATLGSALGTISGTVTASGGGAGIGGTCVDVFGSADTLGYNTATASVVTNAQGQYSASLPPGTYKVRFNGGCGSTSQYVTQWNGGFSQPSDAPAVDVNAGITTNVPAVIVATSGSTGSISGVVTSGGTGVSGICIDAQAVSAGGPPGFVSTGAGGTYTLGGLNPGTYIVEFSDGCGQTGSYSAEYYKNQAAEWQATWLSVSAGQTVTGINASMTAGGSIGGTVTGTGGAPLDNVCVDASSPAYFGTTRTGTNGAYSISGLPPSTYTVTFSPCGAGPYMPTSSIAVVTTNATTTVNATLALGATISGTVTNGSGTGLGYVCVDISPVGQSSYFYYSAMTNGTSGSYQITVPAGTYTVEFGCSNQGGLSTQWYHSASSAVSATPVTVAADGSAPNIDGELLPTGSVSGIVTGLGGAPVKGACVDAVAPGQVTVSSTQTSSTGAYSITGLDPGSYHVLVAGCTGGADYVSTWYPNATQASDAKWVTITSGAATANINVPLTIGGSISGVVTTTTGVAPGTTCVDVFRGSSMVGYAFMGTPGVDSYTVAPLAPGAYQVEFVPGCGTTNGEGLASQWYDAASTQAAAATVIVQASQDLTGVNAQLAGVSGFGAITGTVSGAGTSGPSGGICVNAYKSGTALPATPVSTTVTAANGTYALLVGLKSASYVVEFDPTCGGTVSSSYAIQWYNGVTSESGATAITLASGQEVGGINDQL